MSAGEGLQMLSMLAMQHAEYVVELSGLEFTVRAMRCHACLAPLQVSAMSHI